MTVYVVGTKEEFDKVARALHLTKAMQDAGFKKEDVQQFESFEKLAAYLNAWQNSI